MKLLIILATISIAVLLESFNIVSNPIITYLIIIGLWGIVMVNVVMVSTIYYTLFTLDILSKSISLTHGVHKELIGTTLILCIYIIVDANIAYTYAIGVLTFVSLLGNLLSSPKIKQNMST